MCINQVFDDFKNGEDSKQWNIAGPAMQNVWFETNNNIQCFKRQQLLPTNKQRGRGAIRGRVARVPGRGGKQYDSRSFDKQANRLEICRNYNNN